MEEHRCAFCDGPAGSISFSREKEGELSFCDAECLRSYIRHRKLMRYLP